MKRFLCVHGHFYQPPRENPWLEAVEIQDSAHPYHDWNERVAAECYAPNSASRILDGQGRITDIVGNYGRMSFDFGPTLLSWMERHAPETYQAVLDADRTSAETRSGHGNAIAQAYHHIIMPLANSRDKRAEIRWGIRDFEHRFKRFPEGMWLPETAVDMETLEILSECGIRFTILAPHQAHAVRRLGRGRWEDVGGGRIDPTRPYLCRLPSGGTIHLFFYDGPISRSVAFENLLSRGEDLVGRLLTGFSDVRRWPQFLNIATDGETYGHHRKFADMALAYALNHIESNNIATLTNYGEFLARHAARHEVRFVENTSWSCVHGVERWRTDCGCNPGGHADWNQAWRAPLREAFDWLRDELAPHFEEMAGNYVTDPWRARESYVDVVFDRSAENMENFFSLVASKELTPEEKTTALSLMELGRHLLLMYTSCGWFFDELSGIETVQVLRYAARALQLAEGLFAIPLEENFMARLSRAKSNLADRGNGAAIYEQSVKPAMVSLTKVAAHYAMSSLIEDYGESANIYCYTVNREDYRTLQAGVARLVVGRVGITSMITRAGEVAAFSLLHLGGHVIEGGAKASPDIEEYRSMRQEMIEAFERGAFTDIVRLIDGHFGGRTYSLLHLFRDQQRKVLGHVIEETLEGFEHAYRLIYENNRVLMLFLQESGMPVPKAFLTAAEFTLNLDIKRAFNGAGIDVDKARNAVNELGRWRLDLDRVDVEFLLRRALEAMMDGLDKDSSDLSRLARIHAVILFLPALSLEVNLWRVQNLFFKVAKTGYADVSSRASAGDGDAARWIESFRRIGQGLSFNVDAVLFGGRSGP
jgi:alpha-amylase/alpha-mannosidase (GH57 family)